MTVLAASLHAMLFATSALMGLAAWFDEMQRDFTPIVRQVNSVKLLPGELVYLDAPHVQLKPHQPTALLDDWSEREAPRLQPRGRPQLASWANIGSGRLLLTSHRLLWTNSNKEVDFFWPTTTTVYLWMQNTLGIRYGAAPYHFLLGKEVGLKWLTYANTFAQEAARRKGNKPPISDPETCRSSSATQHAR